MGQGDELERALGRVEDAMLTTVVVLRPDQLLGTAARQLEDAGVSGGPVLDRGRVVGMVTLRDLFEAGGVDLGKVATSGPWLRYEGALDRTGRRVQEVMTRSVITLHPGTPITQAAVAMHGHGVNRIPVVAPTGELKGIVTRDDVVAAVARAARREALEPHPGGSRTEPN